MANLKVKSVNAYIKENGKKLVVIELDNKDKIFLNEGLLAYACQNAKQVKQKNKEQKED